MAAAGGPARIAALKGLNYCGVSLPDSDRWLHQGLKLLEAEIIRQVLPDGGHASRNPSMQLAIFADLIALQETLAAAHILVPGWIPETIDKMAPLLRALRHGDGGLALFNGAAAEDPAQETGNGIDTNVSIVVDEPSAGRTRSRCVTGRRSAAAARQGAGGEQPDERTAERRVGEPAGSGRDQPDADLARVEQGGREDHDGERDGQDLGPRGRVDREDLSVAVEQREGRLRDRDAAEPDEGEERAEFAAQVLPDGGHFFPIVHGPEFCKVLTAFLQES